VDPSPEAIEPLDDLPQGERRRFMASAGDAGDRLDRALSRWIPEWSRSRLAQLADEGLVELGGKPARPAARVKAGDVVEVTLPPPAPAAPLPEDLPLRVLHEDADVVVLDKAPGMVVHPAAGVISGTLVNALLFHVQDLGGVGGELRPGIVHRLDKDTSGCIAVAKHDAALYRLQQAFQARTVDKRYLALVHGAPPDRGTFDTPFGRHPVERVRMTGRLRDDDPGARRAVTHYEVVERFGADAALVSVQLETGRTHQIRVHFSEAGHPLLADATYGGAKRDKKAPEPVRRASEAVGRQALHAASLSFPHPRTGAVVRCEAPVPADLAAALAALRGR
jgi:23S rRNA pseudouridine1911/1915/1917 synthase